MLRAAIIGTGSAVPEKILTNFDLEKMVDTSDEWIRRRTGIVERRIADENTASSDLGFMAAQRAIEDAGVDPLDLEAVIVSTVTPDHFFPSTACIIQGRLGARNAGAFDLLAGCSGFSYALAIADSFIRTGMMKTLLVIAAETLTKVTDWTDRSTCVLFGDAAGAAVVSATEEDRGILSSFLGAAGEYSDPYLLGVPAGGSRMPATRETVERRLHYLKMRGKEVFKLGVRMMPEAGFKALEMAGLTPQDVDLLIPHQANTRIIDVVGEKLGIPKEKVYVNVDRYGNTSSATVAVALDEVRRNGIVGEGDVILMVTFGSGMTYAGTVIRL
ncbi:TPA: ketoacyl-ACP synthase III [Candidatus Poribacteria bacterium]|nr:ketoacyl-ACP synthase III [Candidatus Poribacteria bacterium]HEX30882.1 ketoacyl-ACP synthase III [Candidatus Poribacteria bacterium]